jgi:periplasmic divalent cation tolerance protein
MTRIIVFSTCANKREATEIGRELLKRRLAACVNLPPIFSLYWWESKVRSGAESLLMIKTRAEVFGKLQAQILELSSYELLEIVSVKINDGLPSYLKWIDRGTHRR